MKLNNIFIGIIAIGVLVLVVLMNYPGVVLGQGITSRSVQYDGNRYIFDNQLMFQEISSSTCQSSYACLYTKSDNRLYFVDGAGQDFLVAGQDTPQYKSYTFRARAGASGEYYIGGYYKAPAGKATLTLGAATQNYGTANSSYAAHAFIVSGGNGVTDGSDMVLTVSGASIDDEGNYNGADSETLVLDATNSPVDTYYETTKKWLGTITYTLTSTGATGFTYSFNYGFAKYEDFGNRTFHITDFECTGLAEKNDNGFNIELFHHKATGWTYDAVAFDPGPTPFLDMNVDHDVDEEIDAGEHFAYKRASLDEPVSGSNSEGTIVGITTSVNDAVDYANCHVGVELK